MIAYFIVYFLIIFFEIYGLKREVVFDNCKYNFELFSIFKNSLTFYNKKINQIKWQLNPQRNLFGKQKKIGMLTPPAPRPKQLLLPKNSLPLVLKTRNGRKKTCLTKRKVKNSNISPN